MIALATILFIVNMGLVVYLSILYGSIMVKKTGKFEVHSLISACIHIALSVISIICWCLFAASKGWLVVFGGIVLGLFLFVVGEIVIFIFLYEKKEKFIEFYHNEFNEEGITQVDV